MAAVPGSGVFAGSLPCTCSPFPLLRDITKQSHLSPLASKKHLSFPDEGLSHFHVVSLAHDTDHDLRREDLRGQRRPGKYELYRCVQEGLGIGSFKVSRSFCVIKARRMLGRMEAHLAHGSATTCARGQFPVYRLQLKEVIISISLRYTVLLNTGVGVVHAGRMHRRMPAHLAHSGATTYAGGRSTIQRLQTEEEIPQAFKMDMHPCRYRCTGGAR